MNNKEKVYALLKKHLKTDEAVNEMLNLRSKLFHNMNVFEYAKELIKVNFSEREAWFIILGQFKRMYE